MEHSIEYKENQIHITADGVTWNIGRGMSDEQDQRMIASHLEMLESEAFYKSEDFTEDFYKHLETVILATRGGGSGAVACRDTLLSLYNGRVYKANLSNWYNLDRNNRAALLFVLEHQTASHRKEISQYLPQYKADFDRMQAEVSDD